MRYSLPMSPWGYGHAFPKNYPDHDLYRLQALTDVTSKPCQDIHMFFFGRASRLTKTNPNFLNFKRCSLKSNHQAKCTSKAQGMETQETKTMIPNDLCTYNSGTLTTILWGASYTNYALYVQLCGRRFALFLGTKLWDYGLDVYVQIGVVSHSIYISNHILDYLLANWYKPMTSRLTACEYFALPSDHSTRTEFRLSTLRIPESQQWYQN